MVFASRNSFDLKTVTIINDLEAIAYSVGVLEPNDLAVLNEKEDPKPRAMRRSSPQVLVWARPGFIGTALGVFLLHAKAAIPILPLPMTSSTPCSATCVHSTDTSVGSASVCGPGLFNIYKFFRETGQFDEPDWLRLEIEQGDPASQISRHGIEGTSVLCVQALDLFVSLYGSEAGNLALKMMATGGVFLGGGIAPKIVDKLRECEFSASVQLPKDG